MFMYYYSKGFLPNSFRKMFTLTNQVYSYKTRNSNSFYTFPYRTIIRKFLIGFQGPKFFYSLSLKDIFFNSDDQAIYCNKLTQRGGGVIWTPHPHRFSKRLQIKDQALACKQLWISSLLSITTIKF